LIRDFHKTRPLIVGALLDTVSAALRNYDSTRLERLPRMADFVKWAAAELAWDGNPDHFFARTRRTEIWPTR
jgi:hypothetical protein